MKMTPEDTVKYVNNEINEYQKLSAEAAKQANETSRFLSGQLILIAGTIITISAAFMVPANNLISMGNENKILLASAWSVMVISIIFGCVDILITRKFFSKWQDYHYKMAEELSKANLANSSIKNILNDARKKLAYLKPKSEMTNIFAYSQVTLLGIGLVWFLLNILMLLFV